MDERRGKTTEHQKRKEKRKIDRTSETNLEVDVGGEATPLRAVGAGVGGKGVGRGEEVGRRIGGKVRGTSAMSAMSAMPSVMSAMLSVRSTMPVMISGGIVKDSGCGANSL